MSDATAEPKRPAESTEPPVEASAAPSAAEPQAAPETQAAPHEPPPAPQRPGAVVAVLLAALVVLLVAVAAAPFWAPAVMPLLPWSQPAAAPSAAAPAGSRPAPVAPDPEIAPLRAQAAQNAAALQQLGQRLAALEARPAPAPPDLTPLQQQLAALTRANGDLNTSVAALQKAVQNQPVVDPNGTALALVLLQIREAVDLAHPFDAEYRALLALARDRPEIVAAAQPLAGAAKAGVASRAALTARLRELAPAIATAAAPSPDSGWRSRIAARLRGLVTIRKIDGGGQTPAEAAAGAAERDMAGGDLAGAVEVLAALSGPARDAAEPWLQTARDRLAVESALHRLQTAVIAALGAPGAGKG